MALTNLNTVTVQGTFVDIEGQPLAGQVKFTPTSAVVDSAGNQIILPKTIIVVLNGSGSFSVSLAATNDPDITPTFLYTVNEEISGGRTYTIEVPYDTVGAIDLADVGPVAADAPQGPTAGRTVGPFLVDLATLGGSHATGQVLMTVAPFSGMPLGWAVSVGAGVTSDGGNLRVGTHEIDDWMNVGTVTVSYPVTYNSNQTVLTGTALKVWMNGEPAAPTGSVNLYVHILPIPT